MKIYVKTLYLKDNQLATNIRYQNKEALQLTILVRMVKKRKKLIPMMVKSLPIW